MKVNLSIKSVPAQLAERLRARAERNHRSLQGELMAIVERAAAEFAEGQPGDAAQPALRRAAPPSPRRGGKTIEQIAAEHRALYPQPFAAVPRAVDIVREARDSR